MGKFKKKPILIGLVCVLILAVAVFLANVSQGAYTTSKPIQVLSQDAKVEAGTDVRDLSPVVCKTVLVIDGKKNPLLCTFESNENAMANVKKKDAELLTLMKQKWGLAELSSSNWKDYQHKLIPYTAGLLPDDLGGEKYDMQHQQISDFLGIYEDEILNRESLDYVARANIMLNSKILRQVSLMPLIDRMPFDNPIVQEYGEKSKQQLKYK